LSGQALTGTGADPVPLIDKTSKCRRRSMLEELRETTQAHSSWLASRDVHHSELALAHIIFLPLRCQYSTVPHQNREVHQHTDTEFRDYHLPNSQIDGRTGIEPMRQIMRLLMNPKHVSPTGGANRFSSPPRGILNNRTPAQFLGIMVAVTTLCLAALPVWAQESSEIAKQAQNPIASLISVPIENDFNPQTGINKQDSYVLEMKPVVPFKLSNDWTLITRTIIPVIQVPDLAPGVDGTTGVGDVQLSLFLSPAKAGPVIWGAGPVVSFPTASQEILGTKKVSVGPTVVVLRIQGHWLFGTLVQNLFSVAGPAARPDVNQMLLQPFANYNLPHGWYLTSSPIITANWEVNPNQRWVVPVGGGFGKIVHFGKLPVNMYTQFFRNVERPDGTTHWSARFQAQLLFPKHKQEKQ
jgi:hypothetical protein